MMSVISAVTVQGLQPLAQQSALQDLGLEYKSRGKGKGKGKGRYRGTPVFFPIEV